MMGCALYFWLGKKKEIPQMHKKVFHPTKVGV